MDDRAPIWTKDEPQSPCVNICVIHPQEGICVGCYRTLDEIATWGGMSADGRRAVLAELPARKPLLKKRRGGRNGRRDP
ncbi:MAG: DUF1289 domain-containing protein [Paracoccus sp. (in: a-proteobacteria)]|uniref:DUF1289 domain-containing protein n=1 Tax=Paracoccus sp. TaxID=267 RepID=UPI0026DF4BD0|nr:DUF1289 domain-containing protein [Paracoccus sp. (in: a-proteobacteria)]MDO5630693.1 DUF1289 domain-containing protein [Paracoccus sp. (in: a-proteobacteria)]